MNGAWVLPATEVHRQLFTQLAKAIRSQGGHASILSHAEIESDALTIQERFAQDRAREYEEFQSRSAAFFAEIVKERKLKKFTFAELEEIDDDFVKLNAWLDKIVARDFFPKKHRRAAILTLKRCDVERKAFARSVYAAEGLQQDDRKDE